VGRIPWISDQKLQGITGNKPAVIQRNHWDLYILIQPFIKFEIGIYKLSIIEIRALKKNEMMD
jgi:hypothetical protein